MAADGLVSSCFELAVRLVKDVGEVVKEGFHGVKEVALKGGKAWNLVTDYDTRVEHLLISEIRKQYPDHLFIGEEETEKSGVKPSLTDQPTWIIDPIDGTTNYVRGLPLSCVSVALAVTKQVVLGIVYNPMTEELFTAVRGQGAFLNGRPISTSQATELRDALVATEPSLARISFLRSRTLARMTDVSTQALGVRGLGSVAMSLCYVANGACDAFFMDGPQCWDVAAGVLILQEAGGYVSHPHGGEYDMFSRTILSAANKTLATNLAAVLKSADERGSEKSK